MIQLKRPTKGAASTASSAPASPKAPKSTDLVGLDLSDGTIAAVRVHNGEVQRASVIAIEPGSMKDGEVVDPAALGSAIGDFFKANGLPKKVRLGLASQKVVIRTIELPMISDPKQLKVAVEFQAQDQIPMPLSEAVLDFQVVQNIVTDETQKMRVVVVAASKALVEGFMSTASRAGIKVMGIDLDAFALIRVLYPGDALAGETIAYVHYGDMVNVTLAEGRACTFTRATSKGYEEMIGFLSTRAKLTRDHAKLWVEHVGLTAPLNTIEGDEEIIRATRDELEVAVENLGTDVRAAIDFYAVQEGARPVTRVLLTGPGTVAPGLAERLAARVGIPVETPVPLGGLGTTGADSAGIDARQLTLAAGLALDEVVTR